MSELILCLGPEKTMEHESDGDTNSNQCARYNHQRIGKGTRRIGNKNTSGDPPNYSIIKFIQKIKESCCHSNSSGRPSADAGVKNSQRSKIMKQEKFLKLNCNRSPIHRDKQLSSPLCKIIRTIFKMNKIQTHSNESIIYRTPE